MQFEIESPEEGFLLLRLTGLVSIEAWEHALHDIGKLTRPMPQDHLLINLTGLVGWLGVPERTKIGALAATHLAHMKKVAFVIQPEKISGVTEAQANKTGLALRVLSSHDAAVGWLTGRAM